MNTHAAAPGDPPPLAAKVSRLARTIAAPHYPAGDRAALRRWSPDQPIPLAFYRLWLRHGDGDLPIEAHTEAWMALAWGIATLGAEAHRPGRALGQALAESGYAEARLERLLAAPDELRIELFMAMLRFLAAKNESIDWTEAAAFLLAAQAPARERMCRRLAQAFYRHQPRNDDAKE